MPTALKPIIFGKDKRIDFKKFNVGSLLKAIAYDCEELGQKGVQGIKIADNYKRLISYEEKAKRAKDPYLQAGVAKGSLWLVVRDKSDAKFEAIDLVVKDYSKIKAKLAQATASVTDVSPHDDKTVKDAVKNKTAGLKADPKKDKDYGEITGNIVLIAHGTPAILPSGRVVGTKLGRKSPKEIVKLLTGSPDPKKRIGKDFRGQITLCGCFTASGGPEAEKQDDPFAKKVLTILRGAGYSKVSVVGHPGAAIVSSGNGKDSQGKALKQGDTHVKGNQPTEKERALSKKLAAAITKTLKARNDLVDPYNKAATAYRAAAKELKDAIDGSDLDQAEFVKTKDGAKLLKALDTSKKNFEKVKGKFEKADAANAKAKKAAEDSGLEDTYAQLEGRFGLRQIN